MVTVKSWGPIQKCNFWWGSIPQLLIRVTKNSIEPTAKFWEALASLECLNQRRWVRSKVWAPSKIIILDGAQIYTVGSNLHSVDLSQKELYRAQCSGEAYCARVPSEQHVIFRLESQNIWTKKMLALYKVWALYKTIIFDGAQILKCWSEPQRILSSPRPNCSKLRWACDIMRWWSIGRKSSIRTTCNLPLWVVKHLNQRRWWLYKGWAPSNSIIFWWGSNLPNWSESQRSLSSPLPNCWKLRLACNVMRWCSILLKSSTRTTCTLRLWVVKHLNQRRWWLYKVWTPSESIIFDGAQVYKRLQVLS